MERDQYSLIHRPRGPFDWPKSPVRASKNLLLVGSYDEMLLQAVIAGLSIIESGDYRYILQKRKTDSGWFRYIVVARCHKDKLSSLLASLEIEVNINVPTTRAGGSG